MLDTSLLIWLQFAGGILLIVFAERTSTLLLGGFLVLSAAVLLATTLPLPQLWN